MTNFQAATAQHKYSTRKQSTALGPHTSESDSRSQIPPNDPEPPSTFLGGARARSVLSDPMAPVLAGISIIALSRTGTETEKTLLALCAAIEKVERDMLGEEVEGRDGEVEGEGKGERRDSMCSKVPFVEMLVEEAGRVDRENLVVLLRYIGDLVRAFEGELEALSGR